MNYEEALIKKRNQIADNNGSINADKIYIVPEIREEADAYLKFILRGVVKYSDSFCKEYSSNGKFVVWINK